MRQTFCPAPPYLFSDLWVSHPSVIVPLKALRFDMFVMFSFTLPQTAGKL